MNESGVLGKFVPEFGKIVALMQFNMYHHYTVDEHLIRAVGVMAEIANGGLRQELPLTHELLPSLNDTRLLYVALFLHDIAKGRPEDHSIAGARIARKFCPRLGLDRRRDRDRRLADRISPADERDRPGPRYAGPRDRQGLCRCRAVAAASGAADDPDRLRHPRRRARASGPAGRARCCARSITPPSRCSRAAIRASPSPTASPTPRRSSPRRSSAWPQAEVETYMARHYNHYWLRAELELQIEHARMIRAADNAHQPFAGSIRVQAFEGITEVSFYTPDHPRLLSLIAGACTMCEASIIGAQIFSTRDGRALDTFRLRRAFTSDEDEKVRANRIIDTVKQLLQGKRQILIDLGKDSRLQPAASSPSRCPPRSQVSNNLSEKFTVIEVSGLDRTGLLHQLTRDDLRSQPHHRLGPYRHLWRKGRRRLLRHRSDRP